MSRFWIHCAAPAALAALVLFCTCPGAAATKGQVASLNQHITAIVNDEVISAYDLEQRMRLVVSSSGLSATPEAISRIQPEVLRGLVDERLQLQEARKEEIKVEEQEVTDALGAIAQQNNMAASDVETLLKRDNVDSATLRDQLRADIAWSKLVNRRFGARVNVSDDEVTNEFARASQAVTEVQYLLAEIILRIDQPDREAEVQRVADDLIGQLRSGKASFSALAQQFSESSTAATGGDLGWTAKDQLDPAVFEVIQQLSPGQISKPIRTSAAYHIMLLRQRRDSSGEEGATIVKRVTLKALVVQLSPAAPKAEIEAASKRAAVAAQKINGCGSVAAAAQAAGLQSVDFPNLSIEQVAAPLRPLVSTLRVGEPSPPFRGPAGIQVMVVCDRVAETQKTAYTPPTREEVEARLYNQQISMMARRYLRDLRRDAVIEYR